MHSIQKSYPNAYCQLNTLATGTGAVILVYGVYSLGRIFIAGAVYGSLGAITGLLISAPPETQSTPLDGCFDGMEQMGIFLVRKSVSVLREGFKNALSGMANESASVIQPWYQFYKSFSPQHKKNIETTEKKPLNPPVNQKKQTTSPDESDLYKAYFNLP